MQRIARSCSKKPWPRWRSSPKAATSMPLSVAADTAAACSMRWAPRADSSASTAIPLRKPRREPRFVFRRAWFSELPQVLDDASVATIDGVLFDLGVSSPQLDDPQRGFSFRADGPLDMRMDPSRGASAEQWLATATERELRGVIATYGEERFAAQIARAI